METLLILLAAQADEFPLSVDGRPSGREAARGVLDRYVRIEAERRAATRDTKDPGLANYLRYFDEGAEGLGKDDEAAVGFDAVVREAGGRRLVVLGDLHDSAACRRNEMTLLRALGRRRKIVLGLECVPVQSKAVVQAFLEGKAGREETVRALAPFWSYFSTPEYLWMELLELARDGGFRVEPLEDQSRPAFDFLVAGRTWERDRAAADRIRVRLETLKPGETLCVIYGYAHLFGPGHLVPRLDRDALVVTPVAPVQHLRRAAPSPLRIREGVYYLPCLDGDALARWVEGQTVDQARLEVEAFWLARKYQMFGR